MSGVLHSISFVVCVQAVSNSNADFVSEYAGIRSTSLKTILCIVPKLSHISITEKLYKLSYNVAGKAMDNQHYHWWPAFSLKL